MSHSEGALSFTQLELFDTETTELTGPSAEDSRVQLLESLRGSLAQESERYSGSGSRVKKTNRGFLWITMKKAEEPTLFYGLKVQGRSSLISEIAAFIDTENIVWFRFWGAGGSHKAVMQISAILRDGEFTAVDREIFAPRKQTAKCYGVPVQGTIELLDSPLAIYLDHFWGPKGIKRTDYHDEIDSGRWGIALLNAAQDVLKGLTEFEGIPEEKQRIAATFLSDGLAWEEILPALDFVAE